MKGIQANRLSCLFKQLLNSGIRYECVSGWPRPSRKILRLEPRPSGCGLLTRRQTTSPRNKQVLVCLPDGKIGSPVFFSGQSIFALHDPKALGLPHWSKVVKRFGNTPIFFLSQFKVDQLRSMHILARSLCTLIIHDIDITPSTS